MTKYKAFRQAVKVWLAQHDRSQAWLAERLGVHESVLSRALRGRYDLSDAVAVELERLTGIAVRELTTHAKAS